MRFTWEVSSQTHYQEENLSEIYSYRAVIETSYRSISPGKAWPLYWSIIPKAKPKDTSQMSLGPARGACQLRLGPFQRTPASGEGEAFIGWINRVGLSSPDKWGDSEAALTVLSNQHFLSACSQPLGNVSFLCFWNNYELGSNLVSTLQKKGTEVQKA